MHLIFKRIVSLFHVRYFHVCGGGLLPDIMHDLLEGVLQYEVKLMLQQMIGVDEYFTPDQFNLPQQNWDTWR